MTMLRTDFLNKLEAVWKEACYIPSDCDTAFAQTQRLDDLLCDLWKSARAWRDSKSNVHQSERQ